MAKCHRNDVATLLHHHRSWRRKLLDTMRCGGSSFRHQNHRNCHEIAEKPQMIENRTDSDKSPSRIPRSCSHKLSDLLSRSDSLSSMKDEINAAPKIERESEIEDAEVKKKVERFEEMAMAVKMLREEREKGAKMVRRLAKEDSEARITMAMLGAIPPLIGMIDDEEIEVEFRIEALYAILNLGIGNDLNKEAIVQAGAVHKMLKMIQSSKGCPEPSISEAIVANFLALSASDSNKPIIGSSGAIPFLVNTLKDKTKKWSSQTKQDALRALYNLLILPSNVTQILETDLVQFLIHTLGEMEVSERMLSILSNIISTPYGRKAVTLVPDAFPILIDILNWTDAPGCQEKASYILMIMAHKSYVDRQAMVNTGIMSALLELTLLGSTLAQKRASRILECLSVNKGKQVTAPISGPSTSTFPVANLGKEGDDVMMSEEKKAVKQLVQQSLQNNMKRIVKRANLPQEFVPSEHLKSLTSSSTSKSLPF